MLAHVPMCVCGVYLVIVCVVHMWIRWKSVCERKICACTRLYVNVWGVCVVLSVKTTIAFSRG